MNGPMTGSSFDVRRNAAADLAAAVEDRFGFHAEPVDRTGRLTARQEDGIVTWAHLADRGQGGQAVAPTEEDVPR